MNPDYFYIKSWSNGALSASGKMVSAEMKNKSEMSDLISSFLTFFLDNHRVRWSILPASKEEQEAEEEEGKKMESTVCGFITVEFYVW